MGEFLRKVTTLLYRLKKLCYDITISEQEKTLHIIGTFIG